ncbi:hypothetical protein PRZ48_010108 [Zasmidium cellare]|uniref:Uncharacterized protein n=1 Tax=Zasmidium cellare TaxID=395010 RepID=A0ABR0EEM6_ZASCE|nr:hypothetical protein PRZ48_010108 [Zasmidium cellare]
MQFATLLPAILGLVATAFAQDCVGTVGTCDPSDPQICMGNGQNYTCETTM